MLFHSAEIATPLPFDQVQMASFENVQGGKKHESESKQSVAIVPGYLSFSYFAHHRDIMAVSQPVVTQGFGENRIRTITDLFCSLRLKHSVHYEHPFPS